MSINVVKLLRNDRFTVYIFVPGPFSSHAILMKWIQQPQRLFSDFVKHTTFLIASYLLLF